MTYALTSYPQHDILISDKRCGTSKQNRDFINNYKEEIEMKNYKVKVTSDKNYPNIFLAEHTVKAKSLIDALSIIEKQYGGKEIQEKQLGFEVSITK